jgi:hypothetical protein
MSAKFSVGDRVSVSATGLVEIGRTPRYREQRRVPGVIVSMRFDEDGVPFYTVDIAEELSPGNSYAITVRGWRLRAI